MLFSPHDIAHIQHIEEKIQNKASLEPKDGTVLTYASPVFAHAAPYIEIPDIAKYMKNASKRFFDIAGSHPNALLGSAVVSNHRTFIILSDKSRAVDTPACHPAAFGEVIIEIQLLPTKLFQLQGKIFNGFHLHTTRVHERAGVRYAFFYVRLVAKKEKKLHIKNVVPTDTDKQKVNKFLALIIARRCHHAHKIIALTRPPMTVRE
ncbi:hypothetical protein EVAR_8460_1 [Eumeta japonica]|uniref:Uncharacterized protein n=1 Tax=Eumeta variegata TaxID=151549 RepID=A0A4C1WCP5_EUMVA|nr:hypothetical protein EVAR_8460_1 [Eumeta japonica]